MSSNGTRASICTGELDTLVAKLHFVIGDFPSCGPIPQSDEVLPLAERGYGYGVAQRPGQEWSVAL